MLIKGVGGRRNQGLHSFRVVISIKVGIIIGILSEALFFKLIFSILCPLSGRK